MDDEEIEYLLNNNRCWRLMNEIVKLKGNYPDSIPELSKILLIHDHHSYFRKIIELLLFKEFLIVKYIGKYRLIQKIKYKQLAKFLREGKDFKYSGNIIELTTIGHHY